MTADPSEGGFQEYTILHRPLVSTIPDTLSFSAAAVLPLGVATAAAGLYQKDHLALDLPKVSAESNGKAVVIWGGSSSVGSCAIQLAKASGYEVIATASKRNLAYCEELGATHVVDYNGGDVAGEIVAALEGKELAGIFDAIASEDTVKVGVEISSKAKGTKKIATTGPGTEKLGKDGVTVTAGEIYGITGSRSEKAFADILSHS